MKYMTLEEIKSVQSLIKFLNENHSGLDVSIGNIEISDSNGDRLGWVGWTESDEFGFILEEE